MSFDVAAEAYDGFMGRYSRLLSGQLAGRFADLWLTQWRHLARPGGPNYIGSVL